MYAFAAAIKGIGKSCPEGSFKDILKSAKSGLLDKNPYVKKASVEVCPFERKKKRTKKRNVYPHSF